MAGFVYGLVTGSPLLTAIEVLAFNFCPWFIFFGVYAGKEWPVLARQYVRLLFWSQAIMTPVYFLFFRHIRLPWAEGDLLVPGSGALLVLGIFCFEKNLIRSWFPLLVCSFDTIAAEIRGDWVGLGMALLIWAISTKRLARMACAVGVLIALLLLGFLTDLRLPPLPGRGGEISARDTVGRALSPINHELAEEYSSNAKMYAGTVQWRQIWWKAIREAVFEKPNTTIFGLGYGYPIKDLRSSLRNTDIRSPHSVFYFTLAYSGMTGVLMFAFLQLQLLRLLWRVYKETGEIFGFTCLIFLIGTSLFGNFFESPQRSIPPYILLGMCIGPLLVKREMVDRASLWRGRTYPSVLPTNQTVACLAE
ncbi:MAG: hypothetical protein JO061_23265 [Acidobacteriaceae bacterium]|nr:hypothetical protein [Acidobacteriaceae bacterium]